MPAGQDHGCGVEDHSDAGWCAQVEPHAEVFDDERKPKYVTGRCFIPKEETQEHGFEHSNHPRQENEPEESLKKKPAS